METRSMTERLEKMEKEQKEIRDEQREMRANLVAITATLAEVLKEVKKTPASSSGEKESPAEDGDESEQESEEGEKRSQRSNRGVLQLPSFDGTDPIRWVARANQQFEIMNTPPETKVAAAMVAMEGDALYWTTWLRTRKPSLTWEKFTEALVCRFDTRFLRDAYERLADIKQSGTVDEYINLFVQLSSQVPGLSDAHYLGYFMKGLKDQIRGFLRMFRPTELEAAMDLARDVEANLAMQGGGRINQGSWGPSARNNNYTRSGSASWSGAGSAQGRGSASD